METKICSACGSEKIISEYYIGAYNKNGYSPRCKECIIAKVKARRLEKLNTDPIAFKRQRKIACNKSYYKDLDKSRDYARKHSSQYRSENLELCRKRARDNEATFRFTKPELSILRAAKRRAKSLGLTFNLTKEDIIIPDICPVLGLPIFRGKWFSTDNSPSLDRVNNELGYIKGNVQIISQRANMIKSNGSAEEHEKIANYIRNNLTSTGSAPLAVSKGV